MCRILRGRGGTLYNRDLSRNAWSLNRNQKFRAHLSLNPGSEAGDVWLRPCC